MLVSRISSIRLLVVIVLCISVIVVCLFVSGKIRYSFRLVICDNVGVLMIRVGLEKFLVCIVVYW